MPEQTTLPGIEPGFNLTEGRLDQIVERWNNANGPLKVVIGDDGGENWHIASFGIDEKTGDSVNVTTDYVKASELCGDAASDAEFFVYAHKDIPDLVREVRRLRQLLSARESHK